MSTLVGGAAPTAPIPRAEEVKKFLYENVPMGETRRFRQLDRYDSHYLCSQYDRQQQDWWGLSADQMETVSPEIQVPYGYTQPALALSVRQKRPTAPYNLTKAIVDRFTGLLFSETRKPAMQVEGDPETEDFLLSVMEQMRFWSRMREARTLGGSSGSVLITAHLRDGKFNLENHNAKQLHFVWKDRRTMTPLAVLKMYKYQAEEDNFDPKTLEYKGTKTVEYLYRRIITDQDDTVFKPMKLENHTAPEWVVESQVEHNLGFFPGVWIQNLPSAPAEDIDGFPDCHGAWQNFDTIDRILAQMNKGVLLNLDPTLALNYDPKEIEMMGGLRKGSDHALQLGTSGNARYVEITGSGVKAGQELYEILKKNTLDVVRCVLVDPSQISGAAQSAKAIEYIYAPMLEKADDLRAQYGDLGVLPLLRIIEAMARKYSGKVKAMDEVGNEVEARYAFDLPPKVETDTSTGDPVRVLTERKLGPGGYIRLHWGPYFSPTESDKQQAIANIIAAQTGGLIDKETAIKTAAPIFNVRDPDAMMKKIDEEKQAGMAEAGFGGMPWDGETPEAPDSNTPEEEPTPEAGEGGKP